MPAASAGSPSAFCLRILPVLDLEPPHTRLVGIGEALGNDAFEVIRAHQVEQLASPARTDTGSETIDDLVGKIDCRTRRRSLSGQHRKSAPSSDRMSKAT
jgi:hypothetical protein